MVVTASEFYFLFCGSPGIDLQAGNASIIESSLCTKFRRDLQHWHRGCQTL